MSLAIIHQTNSLESEKSHNSLLPLSTQLTDSPNAATHSVQIEKTFIQTAKYALGLSFFYLLDRASLRYKFIGKKLKKNAAVKHGGFDHSS